MSRVNYLDEAKRSEALDDAVQRKLPTVLSIKGDDGWTAYKTRFLSQESGGNALLLAYPQPEVGQAPPELTPGLALGVSFRRGHKKCLFASQVLRRTNIALDGGTNVLGLVIAAPEQMQQLQRRAYNRASIPPGQSVPIEIWEGGLSGESRTGDSGTPVFAGTIKDISAGGFSMLVPESHDPKLSFGDTVGCRFSPDPNSPPIALDANFRQATPAEDGQVRLGFQIVGLETTPEGAVVLQLLSEWVRDLLRAAPAPAKRRT